MQNQKHDISVVVPVFNEQEVLVELHSRLVTVLEPFARNFEIIFVDDGSRDGSFSALKQIQKSDSRVVVIELSRNFGQTAALAAGIDAAKGDVIVTMDGDLQHSPDDIPRFIVKLDEGFDIVSGWREIRTDNYFLRKFPSACANGLMRYLSGMTIKDFGSTFKAYRAELVKRIELFGELHRFIPVLAHRIGARIVEIPISVHPRKKGSSSYGLGRTFGVFEDLIFLEFYSNYLTKPIRAFGKLFFLFFGCGFLISAVLLLLWLVGLIGAVLEHGALLLFSVFLMIIGIQFLVAGVFAELLTRIYLQTSNSKIYSVRAVLGEGLLPGTVASSKV
jgi:glycosyltransferase involved in cell wall biosynthesis